MNDSQCYLQPLDPCLLITFSQQTQVPALAFQILSFHCCVEDFVNCWTALTERMVLPQTDEILSSWGQNPIRKLPLVSCPLQFPQKLAQFLF